MYRPSKKKSNRPVLIAMVGGAALFMIIVFVVARAKSSPRNVPAGSQGQSSGANLPEHRKKEMYRSLFSLKEMLRSTGSSSRSYQVLADRYKVSIETVRLVEVEGRRKGWPKPGP